MDATAIISEVQRRLIALAEDPPYVFRDTPETLIEQHRRWLTTFTGYSEAEVSDVEARLGGRFSGVFREYLRRMGRARGELFTGSDLATLAELDSYRADALKLMGKGGTAPDLPTNAAVVLSHQGYVFVYVTAVGGFDGPVMQVTDSATQPSQVSASFAELLDRELALMERNHASAHEHGGYYFTLYPGGGGSQEFPALSSGDRPLDRANGGRRKGSG